MKKVYAAFVLAISKIVGRKNLEKLLIYSAKSIDANLHQHGLLQIGAGTNVYLENGGELFFIKNILPGLLKNSGNPVLFDVGANIGNYTLALKEHITNAEVYTFEPVKKTFDQLETNVGHNARLFNIGFGNISGKGLLYNALNTTVSEIATMHKEVLKDVFKSQDEIVAIEFDIDTIDNFCPVNNIQNIAFLKIDVEGNELSVLQGAADMLKKGGVKIVQFEFNTHNIYSRVFLRDFYLLLKDFDFYRLKSNGILILGAYNAKNEIFTAQNIVAIHKTISLLVDKKYLLTV